MISPLFGLAALSAMDLSRTARRSEKLQRKQAELQGKQLELQGQQVKLQEVQIELLTAMSSTMDVIGADLGAIRGMQSEALAIQRELLERDKLQACLEEFIYQAEKLVAECHAPILHPFIRYCLISGLIDYVHKEAIATPIIRGRDNKAAFDNAVSQARLLKKELAKIEEVQTEIQERQRIEEENQAIESEQKSQEIKIRSLVLAGIAAAFLFVCLLPCLIIGCSGMFSR